MCSSGQMQRTKLPNLQRMVQQLLGRINEVAITKSWLVHHLKLMAAFCVNFVTLMIMGVRGLYDKYISVIRHQIAYYDVPVTQVRQLVRHSSHRPLLECPLPKPKEADRTSINGSNNNVFLARFERYEWIWLPYRRRIRPKSPRKQPVKK